MLQSPGKKVAFGLPFVGGGYTPDFGHAFSNRSHFLACGRFWLSSVQQAQTVADKKKIKMDITNLILMVTYLHSLSGATLIGLHQRHLLPSIWQRLVGFGLPSATCANEAQCRIYERWVRIPVLF